MKVLAIILCVVFLLGGIGSVVLYYSPQAVAINAVVGATKDFAKRDEIRPLSNMLKEGSLEFSASEITENGKNMMEDSPVSGKMYFSKDAMMLENLNIKLPNNFQTSGDIYLSNDLIYVKEDAILGGAYGVNPSEFISDLTKSIFAADSGSKHAMTDEDLYDAIIRSGDTLDLNQMDKDAQKLVNKYEKKLWLIVCEHAEFDSNFKSVDLNGTKKTARVVTVEVDGPALANIIEDAYSYFAEDEDVLEFIKTYESILTLMFGELYDPSEYGTLADAFEEVIEDAAPDVEELCDSIKDDEDFQELVFEIVTPKFSAKLLKFTFKSQGVTVLTVDLGEQGMKKTDQITLEYFESEVIYTMKKYDNRSVATLKVDDEKIASITVNKDRGTFKLEAEDYTVSGTLQSSEGVTTLTLDKITCTVVENKKEKITEYKTNIRFVILEEDEIPEAPTSYNRISDITDDDVDGWIQKIEKLES